MFCGFLLVVKVVKGVIAHLGELGVKVICKRSACGKKQLDYWIFHSSLFVIHLVKTYALWILVNRFAFGFFTFHS